MKRKEKLYIVGNFYHHNDTILKPILNQAIDSDYFKEIEWVDPKNYGYIDDDRSYSYWSDPILTYNFWNAQIKGLLGVNGEKLVDNSSILLLEFWNPLIEIVRYFIDAKGLKDIIFSAIMHSSCNIPLDHGQYLQNWGYFSEASWQKCLDKIFVTDSQSYKYCEFNNAIVSYLPYDSDWTPCDKKNQVVACISNDKRSSYMFFRFKEFVERTDPDLKFIIASPKTHNNYFIELPDGVERLYLDRKEYNKLLAESKYYFCWTHFDNFCHATLEAFFNRCSMILNPYPYHNEIYPYRYIYSNIEEDWCNAIGSSGPLPEEIESVKRLLGKPEKLIVDNLYYSDLIRNYS